MSGHLLRWIERGLLVIGVALGLWAATQLIEAKYVAMMPLPEPPANPSAAPAAIVAPATGNWVARLDAPSVHLSATVLEGSDDATLARGAGHIEYTSLPGQEGNVGIAGHRDTTFRVTEQLRNGDAIELTTADRIYRYVVTRTFVVEPEDVYVLHPGDRPMLTLVTCYPFTYIGHAPHRYIIQGVLVDQTPRHGILIATRQ